MSMMKIVICKSQTDAQVAMQRMQQRGMQCQALRSFDDIIWDASQAEPVDAPLAFDNHFVVICTA